MAGAPLVGLRRPPRDWSDAILNSAIMFMNAEVCFYEEIPGATPYDPITGTGGSTEIRVIWSGKARVQQLRAPRDFVTSYQVNSTRFFRYQLDPGDSVPDLPQGTKSRVLLGGRDEKLESLVFVVNSAINSSHMAVRTVELAANMKPITWGWNPIPSTAPFPGQLIFPSYTLFPGV